MYVDEPTIIPDPVRDDASEFVMVGPHAWLTIGATSVLLEINDGQLTVAAWPRDSDNPEPMATTSIALVPDGKEA